MASGEVADETGPADRRRDWTIGEQLPADFVELGGEFRVLVLDGLERGLEVGHILVMRFDAFADVGDSGAEFFDGIHRRLWVQGSWFRVHGHGWFSFLLMVV